MINTENSFGSGQFEERYRYIFAEARDGIVLIDFETGMIADCNPEFERQTGRPQNILRMMRIWELRLTDQIENAKQKFEDIRRIGQGESDVEFQRPNGEIVPIEFVAKKIRLGDTSLILSITRDISERKLLERELAEYQEHLEELVRMRTNQLRQQTEQFRIINEHLQQEILERTRAEQELAQVYEKYQFFFHKSNDGMAIIDCSAWPITPGKHLEVNDVLCNMLGYSRAELLNLSPTDLTAPEVLPHHLARVAALKPGLKLLFESIYLTKCGDRFPMEGTIHLCELNGKLTALTVYRDIRQRRAMEAQIDAHYQEEKTLRESLESRVHRNIEFIRGTIHELKTPLTYMMGTSEILARELSGDAKLSRLANNIRLGTNKLNQRISELIDLAKGEAGLLQIKPKTVRLPPMLHDIVELRLPEALIQRQSIELEIGSVPEVIWADEDRISQIVDNLLSNAIRYTPAGGRIILSCEVSGDSVNIEVTDEGCGISLEEQGSIFEPYSVDRKNTNTLGGLGIGLPLSKMLVELHGGKISLSSEVGKGTRVSFSIPLIKDAFLETAGNET